MGSLRTISIKEETYALVLNEIKISKILPGCQGNSGEGRGGRKKSILGGGDKT